MVYCALLASNARSWCVGVVGLMLTANALAALPPAAQPLPTRLLVVVGQQGTEEYGQLFRQWAGQWRDASERGGASLEIIGLDEDSQTIDRDRLASLLEQEPKESSSELWLVLIGHGTFDGRLANFNLRGPDLSAGQLAEWLASFQRPLAVVNCTASSAPFLSALSGANRVIISATKSGFEENFTYFGGQLARAVGDPAADLDKDGQTSLLEAFLSASAQVAEFYVMEGRLATEHALLDDNGDRLGTPADWFRGTRVVTEAKGGAVPDGLRAHQFHLVPSETELRMPPEIRARRNELELTIFKLRERKKEMAEEDYYRMLEPLLLEMARLYETGGEWVEQIKPES